MGTLMIRCPRTDRAISTEIDTDPAVHQRLPQVAARLMCPACGEVHIWTAKDAWLAETPVSGNPGSEPGSGAVRR